MAQSRVSWSICKSVRSAQRNSGIPDCLVPYNSPIPRSSRSISARRCPEEYFSIALSLWRCFWSSSVMRKQ